MTCSLCPRAVDGYLCGRHRDKLSAQLRGLPELYAEVGECLVPRRSGWGEIVATRGAAGPRSPIDEDILDTVNWAVASEVIHSWRTDIRRLRWPHRGSTPPARLDADCRWLVQELDWIVAQYPPAGELAREVWTLDQQARSVVGDPAPRPQAFGSCVAQLSSGIICGAAISRLPGQTRITCPRCGYPYENEQDWLALLRFQPGAAA
ncbi:hypothetical protein AB0M23_30880 [Streptomyces sp. NPDC052077]|uniref:hypothetical protein n=1 Tax=Streptomyces sp. NPDC052077 TaxID=3154757 RepID=UPI00343EC31E